MTAEEIRRELQKVDFSTMHGWAREAAMVAVLAELAAQVAELRDAVAALTQELEAEAFRHPVVHPRLPISKVS